MAVDPQAAAIEGDIARRFAAIGKAVAESRQKPKDTPAAPAAAVQQQAQGPEHLLVERRHDVDVGIIEEGDAVFGRHGVGVGLEEHAEAVVLEQGVAGVGRGAVVAGGVLYIG